MSHPVKAFVVAAPTSGAGKTTVAMALMAALRARGNHVQPFKCGPDFIDGGYHEWVCGRRCRNLDGWMLSARTNREILHRGARGADISVVEGMMGLFDGAGGRTDEGSTAQIARLLGLPVVLVVDASAASRSVAAMIYGFENFDRKTTLAGVVFNKIAGPLHYRLLRDAVQSRCRTPVLGYLPFDSRVALPERHLGLVTSQEHALSRSAIRQLGNAAAAHVDLNLLLKRAAALNLASGVWQPPRRVLTDHVSVRIGVARDRAFSFYYEDNLDALRAAGAEIVEFSPISDRVVPQNLSALYFGGGYPELYAGELADNRGMLETIREFAAGGSPIYAECGGLMYLARQINCLDGSRYPLAGVLPFRVHMTDRLVHFGYAEVTLAASSLWGNAGARARGHSFHRSRLTDARGLGRAYCVRYELAGREEREGFYAKNVLASYVHLHFLSNPIIARELVETARLGWRVRAIQAVPAGRQAGIAAPGCVDDERLFPQAQRRK